MKEVFCVTVNRSAWMPHRIDLRHFGRRPDGCQSRLRGSEPPYAKVKKVNLQDATAAAPGSSLELRVQPEGSESQNGLSMCTRKQCHSIGPRGIPRPTSGQEEAMKIKTERRHDASRIPISLLAELSAVIPEVHIETSIGRA